MRLLVTLVSAVLLSTAVSAADFPSRPMKVVVPFPPGGITDLVGRLVADGLRAKLNQTVVVENKPGAAGTLGLRELVRPETDGHTLMIGSLGGTVITAAIDSNYSFDMLKDVVPIAGTSEFATVLVVNKNTPVNSVEEFIALAKSRPQKLSFGSTGPGSLGHISAELFMRQTGISMVHVPYRGGAGALNDLLGGSIDVILEVFPVVMEQIKSGGLKALAVTSPQRVPAIPDVPTLGELGIPNVRLTGWKHRARCA
jgi:tripartite-type tricarboxylate transporter receptor subunit TctC